MLLRKSFQDCQGSGNVGYEPPSHTNLDVYHTVKIQCSKVLCMHACRFWWLAACWMRNCVVTHYSLNSCFTWALDYKIGLYGAQIHHTYQHKCPSHLHTTHISTSVSVTSTPHISAQVSQSPPHHTYQRKCLSHLHTTHISTSVSVTSTPHTSAQVSQSPPHHTHQHKCLSHLHTTHISTSISVTSTPHISSGANLSGKCGNTCN